MKKLSIRAKMTILFTLVLVLVAGLTFGLIRLISASVLRSTVRDYLVGAVEENTDKLTYGEEAPGGIAMDYAGGRLSIDNDYLDIINDVECALYTEEGVMLYGRDPLVRQLSGRSFGSPGIYSVEAGGMEYYVYERRLTGEGLQGLWIRGAVPLTRERQQLADITRFTLIILPIIILLATFALYLALGRMLKPIREIEQTAAEISKGTDLKRRIGLGSGGDELSKMAATFDTMFDRLEQSFETEKRFTSDASHELRTPMSVIMAQTELTLEKDRTPEEYKQALRVIKRQGGRMSGLINDMLYYTRLEQRPENHPMATVDLARLVRSVCGDMALIKERGIELTWQTEEECEITGNSELITRLLQNIIGNAYKYGVEGGHIHVTLKDGCLSVADDGIGIPESEKDKIFNRFYRVDGSRAVSKVQGNGLGLSMVKKIADMHGAAVEVESREGKGSTFKIFFKKI